MLLFQPVCPQEAFRQGCSLSNTRTCKDPHLCYVCVCPPPPPPHTNRGEILSHSGLSEPALLNSSRFYRNTAVVCTEGVSLLEDHMSEINNVSDLRTEGASQNTLGRPVLLPAPLYGTEVQKYVTYMLFSKFAGHSFSLQIIV